MSRIVLVNPPVSDVERPSIALGILKNVLVSAGHTVTVDYANLLFADHVGVQIMRLLASRASHEALGDWLFASAAFPDFRPSEDEYLDRILGRERGLAGISAAQWRVTLKQARHHMAEYVEQVVSRILAEEPNLVGCSSTFSQHVAGLAILRRLRERAPDVVTMMGGANCESIMGRTTHQHFEFVDFVVSGEAEEIIGPLCNAISVHGRGVPDDLVPDAVFAPHHRLTGYPVADTSDGCPRATIKEMSSVPMPDFDDYFEAIGRFKHKRNLRPGLLMETSRGCWFGAKSHCTFCGLNGHSMAFRSKAAADVMEEIDYQTSRYGVNQMETVDNILDMKYFDDLIPALAKRETAVRLFYETKSNLRTAQIKLLAEAGIKWIQPGIESLDSRVLKLIRKGVSGIQNIAFMRDCRQHGVYLYWNYMFNFPGEDDTWYEETARICPALFHLQPGNLIGLLYARFSPYHREAKSYGLELVSGANYRYIYPLPEENLRDLVYFFDDTSSAKLAADKKPRPGLATLFKVLDQWSEAWKGEARPICTLRYIDDRFILKDTRPCSIQLDTELNEIDVSLLLVADGRLRPDQAVQHVCDDLGVDKPTVEEALQRLVDAHFVLLMDDRALSVVLFGPVPPLPAPDEYPGGSFSYQPLEVDA